MVYSGYPVLHNVDGGGNRLDNIRCGCFFFEQLTDFAFKTKFCRFIIRRQFVNEFILMNLLFHGRFLALNYLFFPFFLRDCSAAEIHSDDDIRRY